MNILQRFLKYISFDTQSDPSSTTTPSTAKQLVLGKYLVEELHTLGVTNAYLDDYGIVYAQIPASDPTKDHIGFIAHLDTSCDASGKDIQPQYIPSYDGARITLHKELGKYLDPKEFPALLDVIGHELVTTDGTTLLGADDKAGIAIIMQTIAILQASNTILHGPISIAFTPDEEIGKGTTHFDLSIFNADYAYTIDGGSIHELGYETFNAYEATITIHGRSVHPGTAKNEMVNATLVAMEFEQMLSPFKKPQYTEGYEGFNHLHTLHGSCETAKMMYLLRDHDRHILQKERNVFENIKTYLHTKYGYPICDIVWKEQYANMKEILQTNTHSITKAKKAMEAIGLPIKTPPIRGGTDGAFLTFMGLPCPNLGTGGYNFHGPFEYVSITMMKQGVQLLLEILEG